MTGQTLLEPHVDSPAPVDPAPPRRWWRDSWRFPLIAYVAPVALTLLATTTWFSWGRFTATGDIPPFVRDSLATEATSFWSHQATGAGSTSTPILQGVEVVLLRGVGLVGLPPMVAEWLLYALCFGLCTFGAAYLAAGWVRRPVAAAAAGLMATFNVYLLVWLPNPLPPLGIGLGGLLTGMVVRAAQGRRTSPVAFAAATLPASYLALNPPWLLTAVLTVPFVVVAAALTGGRPALRRMLALPVRALPLAVLFNLWWVVPFVEQLLAPAGLAFSAVTDVRDWAWTHNRNTLANVATLNGNWAWTVPGLFPYAGALGSVLRAKLHWGLPLLAFAGVVLAGRRYRRAAWLVAGVTLMLLLLSTGLRSESIRPVNLWLFDHVPAMWLLREPAGKLGILLVLTYTSLAALAIDRVVELAPRLPEFLRSPRFSPRVVSMAPPAAAAGLVLAALAFPAPMWTGAAMPDFPHGEFPSTRVTIPAGWYRLADAVNADPGSGKVLMLPVSLDSYMLPAGWGYRGVDTIPSQLLRRPTLHLLPGGYYSDMPRLKALLIEAQTALLTGDGSGWRGALRALGVGTVIVRHDLHPAHYDLQPSADPDALDAALGRIGDVRRTGAFGVGSLYRVPDLAGPVSAGTRLVGVQGGDAAAVADTIAGLPTGDVAVVDPDRPVAAFRGSTVDRGAMTFTLAAGGPFRLDRTGPDASYRAAVVGDRLTLTDADTVSVDGSALAARPPLAIEATEPKVVGLDVDGDLRVLPPTGDTVVVGPHSTVTAYAAESGEALTGPFRRARECTGTPDGALDPNRLRLPVTSGLVCAVAALQPRPGATYRLHFRARTAGGAKARVCLWQDGPAECAPLPSPPGAPGWAEYTALTRLAPDVLGARLYLYAEPSAGRGEVEYRDVSVTPLRPVGSAAVSPRPAPATQLTLAGGRHVVRVDRQGSAAPPDLPEFRACSSPGARPSPYPTADRRPLLPDGTLTLNAPSYGLCAEADTVPVVPNAMYRLSVDYRTDYGQTPRLCIREDPAMRCAGTPVLTRASGWQTVQATIRPAPGTTTIRPQLDADATYMVSGRVSYRGFRLARVAPVAVEVTPTEPGGTGARVESTAVSPTEYRVAVHGAAGAFPLVLAESYAPGWALDGLPAGWTARHLMVDGYANGWLIEGTGDAALRLRYRPALWSSAALLISLLGGAVTIAVLAGRWVLAVGRRRGWPGLGRRATP